MGKMGVLNCLPVNVAHYNEVRNVPKAVMDAFRESAQGKEYLSAADLKTFFEKFQGEGDGSITETQAEAMIMKYKDQSSSHRLHLHLHHDRQESTSPPGMDLAAFTKTLLNPILNGPWKPRQMTDDMTAPLSQYYVHTSHNSYLTGNQLWSRSSTTPIKEALENGCRVIELDCWEKHGKIKVLHGGTLTAPVKFEDCIVVIKEHAFSTSPYPVIITIENHLKPEFQIEAAKILKRVLGDTLFIPTAEQRRPVEFLSPEELKGKIVISDKPFRDLVEQQVVEDPEGAQEIIGGGDRSPHLSPRNSGKLLPTGFKFRKDLVQRGAKAYDEHTPAPEIEKIEEFEELLYIYCEKPSEMKEKQVKGGPLLTGENAIMANLSEPQLKNFIKTHPGSIIEYTKMNLGRVYPFGLRFDSSNADPMSSWSHGCQLAALNLQGRDRAAWLNDAFFQSNGGCGYVKKPPIFLPQNSLQYEDILNLPPKLNLKVRVLMGTDWHRVFDFFKRPDFYVRVAVKGIPSDTLRKKTKVAFSNKEPNWEDEEFEFPIRVPEIAVLRFEVWEHDRMNPDDFVGQHCIPVKDLLQGIRVVALSSRKGEEKSDKLLCQFKLEDIENSPVEAAADAS
ncbi:unnamed protein product [Calypogeia fissa]